MDILIVDDEALARARLRRFVEVLDHEVIAEAANGEEALDAINVYDPAIVLLDIEMPGDTGLEVAKKIAVLDNPPAIIFTTAYKQYALEAFETLAAAYLLKPVKQEHLEQALMKAQTINKAQLQSLSNDAEAKSSDQRQHLTARNHRGVELIAVSDVRCFLADHKYVMVVSTQGETLIDGTLKELEQEFSDSFIRVHRNALVSVAHITGLNRSGEGNFSVCLKDTDTRPMVSRRYNSKLKSLIKSL